jgi:hypothetical protein
VLIAASWVESSLSFLFDRAEWPIISLLEFSTQT